MLSANKVLAGRLRNLFSIEGDVGGHGDVGDSFSAAFKSFLRASGDSGVH